MVTYPVGTKLYYIYRPENPMFGMGFDGAWFQTEAHLEGSREHAKYKWDPDRITVWSMDEAMLLPWGGPRSRYVDSVEKARILCNTTEAENTWCWVYAGTVWDIDD